MPSSRSSPDAPRSSARAATLAILLACRSHDTTLDDELDKNAAQFRLDARDRGLAMELAYGVLRRLEYLDWRLAPVLKKPLPRLPEAVQVLLRLGAYQLLFLDRIPASAAVDESVRLAKSYAVRLKRDWSGLVNAVLRNLLREPEPALPDPVIDPAHTLSVRHALPLWLCQRWIERLGGPQAEAACRAASEVPGLTLRVNRLRMSREQFLDRCHQEGIAANPTLVSPIGVALEKMGSVTSLPGFQDGDFYVEDEAAQLIPPILDPQPGELVLDACAAPGGKTTHLAELMKNQGRIVAMDRQPTRLALLRDNCRRLGITIVDTVAGDARKPQDILLALRQGHSHRPSPRLVESGFVDRVLLDAPCSGLGVLRRHPEGKWQKHQDMFQRHHDLQAQILTAVSAVLRPGGVLVYSTCSTEREETEDVVEHFCQTCPGWTREPVESWVPSSALSFVTAQGALSTMGNTCGMDGFYAVRLRKTS